MADYALIQAQRRNRKGEPIFTRPLPGTAAKPVAEGEEEGSGDESEGGDEDE